MPEESTMDWFDQAQHLTAPRLDVFFMLWDSVYVGDPDDVDQLQDPTFSVSVELPSIPCKGEGGISTMEAEQHLDELAAHYKRLLAVRRKYKIGWDAFSTRFWLRLFLWSDQSEQAISFPWYDTYPEMRPFLRALLKNQDGLLFFDGDQGWECSLFGLGDDFFCANGDPDDDEGNSMLYVRFARKQLSVQVEPLEARVKRQLKFLAKNTKRKPWKW